MITRPMFYFEVYVSKSGNFGGLLSRLGVRVDPFARLKGPDSILVSFLLAPERSSADYILMAASSKKVRSQARNLEQFSFALLLQFNQGQLSSRWSTVERVKGGLFYSRSLSGNVLAEVRKDSDLCFVDNSSRLRRLGTVNKVLRVNTGLVIDDTRAESLRRNFERVSQGKSPSLIDDRDTAFIKNARPDLKSKPAQLSWQVLPPGWWKGFYGLKSGKGKRPWKPMDTQRRERIEYIDSLGEATWYEGSHFGERLYYVAKFPNIAIADCPEWGNALYYYACEGDEWQKVFRQTKAEALEAGAGRLIHTGNWQDRLREIIVAGVPEKV